MRRRAKVPLGKRARDAWRIFRQSIQAIWREKRLLVFPLVTYAASILLMLAFVGTLLLLLMTGDGGPEWLARSPWLAPAILVLGFPAMVIGSVAGAAFVHGIHASLEGRPVSLRESWRHAWAARWTLVRFSLVMMVVAGVFQVVGIVLNKLRFVPIVGHFFQAVGTLGWAAASFFVLPVIVLEKETSALGAVKRSAGIARDQWGKSVGGIVTIMAIVMIPIFLAMAVMMAVLWSGVIVFELGSAGFLAMMITWGVVMLLLMGVAAVFAGSAQNAYQAALYRYATTGRISAPFDESTLVDAWAPYRRP